MGGEAELEIACAEVEQTEDEAYDEGGDALCEVAVDHGEGYGGDEGSCPPGEAPAVEAADDALTKREFFGTGAYDAEQYEAPGIGDHALEERLLRGVVDADP